MSDNKMMKLSDDELDTIVGGNGPKDDEMAVNRTCPICQKTMLMTEGEYKRHLLGCKGN